jgi:hypothetical protein
MYKVVYYADHTNSYDAVMFKWFKTSEAAFEFSRKLGDRVLETKYYAETNPLPVGYPAADLDLS